MSRTIRSRGTCFSLSPLEAEDAALRYITLDHASHKIVDPLYVQAPAERFTSAGCHAPHRISATLEAFNTGWGGTLAGGTHQAFRSDGAGFCVLNDIAVPLHWARRDGIIRRAAILFYQSGVDGLSTDTLGKLASLRLVSRSAIAA